MPRGLVAWIGWLGLAGCSNPAAAPRDAGDASIDAAPDAALPIDAAPDAPDASPFDAPPGVPDLQFIASEMAHTVVVTADDFRATDCEVVEGCVGAAGRRTLLRFDTVSANRGTADVVIGVPPDAGISDPVFEWSPCHMHHHVKNYASYELVDLDGNVLTARKQAFCLEDTQSVQPGIPSSGYSCDRQGITRGWADVYTRYLPCQWIDVTGLPSGAYTLRIVVNPLKTLTESNYDNNVFTVGVRF